MRISEFCEELLNELRMLVGDNRVFFFNNDFANEEGISRCLKNSPVIFLDFIGDTFIKNTFQKRCELELYVIHTTSSVNIKNREVSFKEQMDFFRKNRKTFIPIKT